MGVWLLLPVAEAVPLGLAPLLRVLAAEALWLELRLLLLVGEQLPVPLPEDVPVGDPVELPVLLPELLSVLLLLELSLVEALLEAVLLGLAPIVNDAVALELSVELPLTVLEGVGAAVPEPEELGVGVAVGLGDTGGVLLPERDWVLEALALAPTEREAVALLLTLLLKLLLGEAVTLAVPLLL